MLPRDPVSALPLPPATLLEGASLFIDFDGTLVDLVDRPDAVVVDPPLRDLLGLLGAVLPGRVAIVSGRSIAQLDAFLGMALPDFLMAGSHGSEHRLADGTHVRPNRAPALDPATAALHAFAGAHPGAIVEEKSFGVTLHYRLAPELEPRATLFARQVAQEHGLEVQPGKMMMELKMAGGDKGRVIETLLRTPAMRGTRPWFIGDDLTDEAGFAAAHAAGGGGILVGDPRPTMACYGLPDVAAVRAWLASTPGLPS